MIKSRLETLRTGKPRHFRDDGAESTIGARMEVDAPVYLGATGFEGDRVADPSVHGGFDKAVHFYPAEHYPEWTADFARNGKDAHPLLSGLGGFGENLSAYGLTEDKVRIGDRFRIGDALVEISQGRQPCWKVDHHFALKGMMAAMTATGRSGFYFRVIEEGLVAPDAEIAQIAQGPEAWTVARTFNLLIAGGHKEKGAEPALLELARLDMLAENWRQRALKLLG